MNYQDTPASLLDLGLNELEAAVYAHLLRQSEAVTAYRVGRALGKATANVYKAVESLEQKGAVTVEDGDRRLCRASPPDELLGQLERDFKAKQRAARDELADLRPAPAGDAVYSLRSTAQIEERAIAMLGRAEEIVVVDAFPSSLEALRAQLEKTASRGVRVHVQAYSPSAVAGCEVVLAAQHVEILSHWKGEQMNLVVDGREALVALFSNRRARVVQAVWTESLYLSCLLQAGALREQAFHRLADLRQRVALPPEAEKVLDEQIFFHNTQVPGQEELASQLLALSEDPS